jgi:hypothetical protein
LLCGVLLTMTCVAGATADDSPPVKGRPLRFNGAVGNFRAAMQVERPEVRVDEPFVLAVRITATGAVGEPPRRPDLLAQANFTDAFHIDMLSDPKGTKPDKDTWEFQYRLRAKNAGVEAVPSLPLIYYKPATATGTRGAYQTTYAPRVPLKITAAAHPPTVTQREGNKPITVPDSVYQITTGPSVLRRPLRWEMSISTVVFLLVVVPIGCVVWYQVWKRWYPDAARLSRRRRSQAAQQALAALTAAGKRPAAERPRVAVESVSAYLRYRCDLPTALPSPDEVEAHLKRMGLSAEAAEKAARFFRDTDAARFAPVAAGSADWTKVGTEVVLLVEAESCPPS